MTVTWIRQFILVIAALVGIFCAGAIWQQRLDENRCVHNWVEYVRREANYVMSPAQIDLVNGAAILNRCGSQ
jgi:hypothetical protein